MEDSAGFEEVEDGDEGGDDEEEEEEERKGEELNASSQKSLKLLARND